MFTVYILFSPSLNRHYIGQTADLSQRLAFHKAGSTAETSRTSDWILIFAEHVNSRADAMRLERSIKDKHSHASIQRFVADTRNAVREPVPQSAW